MIKIEKLPIAKKLAVMIIVFFSIVCCLLFMSFVGMEILSGVRGIVNAEGIWSKSQKEANYYLRKYVHTHDHNDYQRFLSRFTIPLADRTAMRQTISDNTDFRIAEDALIVGGSHPKDAWMMIRLIKYSRWIKSIERAVSDWDRADVNLDKILSVGKMLHDEISSGNPAEDRLNELVKSLDELNEKQTMLAVKFSNEFGDASRWIKTRMIQVMIGVTVLLLILGLWIAVRISKFLVHEVEVLHAGAERIARGDFSKRIEIDSEDEIGDLAKRFQEMSERRQEFEESLRERAKELKDTNRRLHETERLKSEFFANVSHELRTPLTLTIAPMESLMLGEYGKVTDEQQKIFKIIHNNTFRLLQMVTGLLDYAKLEAGKVEVEREPTEIVDLTTSILGDFSPLLQQKGIESTFEKQGEAFVVNIDRNLYERILFNLLSNAAKFTPKGGKINIHLTLENNRLTLKVRDTGIGIKEADIPILFQKFRQLEGSATRRFEGTGLGLALVKEFTELLGGNVSVESQLGQGSTFTMTCLAPQVDSKTIKSVPVSLSRKIVTEYVPALSKEDVGHKNSDEEKLNVMIAEDNLELSSYIVSLLHSFCNTVVVHDGEEALRQIRLSSPDLLITDVMMPKCDGLSICREIKSKPETAKIPVIMLTALTHREALMEGWEAGTDEYLFKPFHPMELVARVRSMLKAIRMRMRVEAREREMSVAMENALEGMAQFDEQGRYLQVNKMFTQLLGYKLYELLNLSWVDIVPPSEKEVIKTAFEKMLSTNKAELTTQGKRKDGSVFNMQVVMIKVNPFQDEQRGGHYIFIKDMTEYRYKEALEIKSEMISTVSHEMRTPMQVMMEGVEIVLEGVVGEVNEEQKDVLNSVSQSINRLSRLVNNVLDFQKMDTENAYAEGEKNDINDLIRVMKKSMDPLLRQSNISVELELSEDLPKVFLDFDRITQVLFNLVDNAIKFSDNQKNISIRSFEENDEIRVAVKDQGIGIQNEDLPKIFRNFGQLETGKKHAPGRGAGLGLAISKKIIEQHHGKMWVESEYQKGSTFYFSLPINILSSKVA